MFGGDKCHAPTQKMCPLVALRWHRGSCEGLPDNNYPVKAYFQETTKEKKLFPIEGSSWGAWSSGEFANHYLLPHPMRQGQPGLQKMITLTPVSFGEREGTTL